MRDLIKLNSLNSTPGEGREFLVFNKKMQASVVKWEYGWLTPCYLGRTMCESNKCLESFRLKMSDLIGWCELPEVEPSEEPYDGEDE